MQGEAAAPDHDALAWCLRQPAVPHHKLAALAPDFLVISPPKTGSTWLADNLRAHPSVFVPAVKEVKYFTSYFRWLDLNWYLDQFAPAGGRRKGEASPSYALLPVERIRLLRRLLPDVKLVFLMRDPVARAWSHAKHTYRFREANFAAAAGPLEAVSDGQWRDNFRHEWTLASGDYLGQLRRWLSVFPPEQLFVGFYEAIAHAPRALLREVFAFLGVSPDVDLAAFPVEEKVLPGLPGELPPALRATLRRLLAGRTRELASFLGARLGLRPPPEWQASLGPAGDGPAAAGPGPAPEVFARERDDRYLAGVLEQEEAFPSAPLLVREGYRGYDIVYYRGRLYALDRALGRVAVNEASEDELRRLQGQGGCFIAPSLAEVQELVDAHVFAQAQAGLRAAGADLRAAREQVAYLARRLNRLESRVQDAEAGLAPLPPARVLVTRLLRGAWRRVRPLVRGEWRRDPAAVKA
jgi:hypothetical protein